MAFYNDWEDNLESGVTPGPEEALQKEIKKSKLLKVERLQSRDEIENLKEQNQHLLKENQTLLEKLKAIAPDEIPESPLASEPVEKADSYHPYKATLIRISTALLFLMVAWLFYFFLTL